jgi:hypothetical protein
MGIGYGKAEPFRAAAEPRNAACLSMNLAIRYGGVVLMLYNADACK